MGYYQKNLSDFSTSAIELQESKTLKAAGLSNLSTNTIAGLPASSSAIVYATGGTYPGAATLTTIATPRGVGLGATFLVASDGAGAVLLMTREKADELGVKPMATIIDSCLVGSDPVLMLTGPIYATQKLLADNGLQMSDIDVVEINEAFASVVLAWEKELNPDMETVNPNGGAIAIGHPLGGTGAILLTKAVHELHRSDKEHAIVTMCCGGGLGTGTLIKRL